MRVRVAQRPAGPCARLAAFSVLIVVLVLFAQPGHARGAFVVVDDRDAEPARAADAPGVRIAGAARPRGRLVARWGGARTAARWQQRTRGSRTWRSVRPVRRVRKLTLVVPARLEGGAIRAQARVAGRLRTSRPRLIGPTVRLRGTSVVGSRLGVVSSARGPIRWQSRPQTGRWRTISSPSGAVLRARTLTLPGILEGARVRALVKAYGRWWPSSHRVVRSESGPAAPPGGVPEVPFDVTGSSPAAGRVDPPAPAESAQPPAPVVSIAPPVVAGIPAVGRTLASTTGLWSADAGPYAIQWERTADGNEWAPIPGAADAQLILGLDSALAWVRACVVPAATSTRACSAAVGPVVGRPAVGVQDDRLPVADLVAEVPDRLDAVDATGVSIVRVDLFWSTIAPVRPADATDPNDPAYDWSRADAVLAGYAERGITPIVSFYSTPSWAAGGVGPPAGTPVNPAIPDAEDVAEFVTALVRRYSGTVARPGSGSALPRIRYLEIWNEPNKRSFLDPQEDALDAYVEIAKAAYPAAKAVSPELTVLVGALGSGGSARTFRDRIVAEDLDLDAFSQHLYPAAAPLTLTPAYPSWSSLPEIVGVLDAWRPDIPLFITEAGYTTAETPFRPPGSSVTEAEQASRLRDIFEMPLVASGRVGAVIWFNFQDNSGWPSGLLRLDGTQKPSYDIFEEVVAIRGAVPAP